MSWPFVGIPSFLRAEIARDLANLDEALVWADKSISEPFIGDKNFQTLSTKAQVLVMLNRGTEADAERYQEIEHRHASQHHNGAAKGDAEEEAGGKQAQHQAKHAEGEIGNRFAEQDLVRLDRRDE